MKDQRSQRSNFLLRLHMYVLQPFIISSNITPYPSPPSRTTPETHPLLLTLFNHNLFISNAIINHLILSYHTMPYTTIDNNLVKTELTAVERNFLSSRLVENIIPSSHQISQPVFRLNYIPKLHVNPIVETHQAVISTNKSAQLKRVSRARNGNYKKELIRRKKKRDETKSKETVDERNSRLAKQREQWYRHKMKKAEENRLLIAQNRVVFLQQPSQSMSNSPFFTNNQVSGEYKLEHKIERFEIHSFKHSYHPIQSTPDILPTIGTQSLFTVKEKPGGRQLVNVTAVFSNDGSPYQSTIPVSCTNGSRASSDNPPQAICLSHTNSGNLSAHAQNAHGGQSITFPSVSPSNQVIGTTSGPVPKRWKHFN